MARYESGHHHIAPRYAYNNSKFRRQLNLPDAGGTKLLGIFFIPPKHTLKSLKMTLTVIGTDEVNDDLESRVGSFITAMDVGDTQAFHSVASSFSNTEEWGLDNLPNTVKSEGQGDDTPFWDTVRTWYDANDEDAYGVGHIIKEGHGRSYDQPYDCIFTRMKKLHPIYGTGMIVGTGSGTGGKYTPIDTCTTTIRRNVTASSDPTAVMCWITAPDRDESSNWSDVKPDMSADSETYLNWIKMHDPHAWKNSFNELDEDEYSLGAGVDAPGKFLSVNYTDSNTDDGRGLNFNCSWHFSAQIAPPPADLSVPNVTVANIRKGR